MKHPNATHQMSRSRIYGRYRQMLNRCYLPTAKSFEDYGGRGISVCDRWRDSFENFYKDMGDPPPGCSLEREDNNGNYEPGNVKWGTAAAQQRNTRQNHLVTHAGKTMCLADWALHFGIDYKLLHNRIRRGWDLLKAGTQPVMAG